MKNKTKFALQQEIKLLRKKVAEYKQARQEIVTRRAAELIKANRQLKKEVEERKDAEKRIQFRSSILKILGKTSSRKEYLETVIKYFRDWSGCSCLGIRILDENKKIPYEAYAGFSKDFWKSENFLSLDHDQCVCIRVIRGNTLPQDISCKTPAGSFHCDDALKFMAGLSKKEQSAFRGVCVQHGYASLAVIPLTYRNTVIGVIHLADRQPGKLPLGKVEFIESLTPLISVGVTRFSLTDQLQQSNELLERFFSNTNIMLAYLDKDFNFIRVNQAYAQADGHNPDFYPGKNHFVLFPDQDNKVIFQNVTKTGQPYITYAKPFVYTEHPERGVTYWDWSLQPVKGGSGQVEGVILGLVNVTERKRIEESLLKAQKDLVEAKRLSDLGTLSATVAHELRNPLGVIRTAVYNIKRKNDNPALTGHLANIEKKVQESEQIISNLLSYARIKLPRSETVNLYNLLEECLKNARNRFQRWPVTVSRKYRCLKDYFISADPLQIKEVFNNILNNAYESLKENRGRIEVKADYDFNPDRVKISFIDNGIGIESGDLERLFEPFFTRKTKGTGLGLAVCQQIIDLHHGKIEVESLPGKGSKFTVIIPSARTEQGDLRIKKS